MKKSKKFIVTISAANAAGSRITIPLGVVADAGLRRMIADSGNVAPASMDWQEREFAFAAPLDAFAEKYGVRLLEFRHGGKLCAKRVY
jgi:hypothetical protein